jgi:hypothetical protein
MTVTLSIELDADSSIDKEFLRWYNENKDDQALIKQSVILGFHVIRNISLIKGENNELRTEYETELKSLNNILDHTVQNYEKRIESIKENKDLLYKDQIDILNEKIAKLKSDQSDTASSTERDIRKEYEPKLAFLQSQLDKFINDNREINRLSDIIKTKEQELTVLKTNNIVKGNIGENIIKTLTGRYLTSYEIADMSSTASMSDIHLIDSREQRIVIECKNKANIALLDVEKSIRDIQVLTEKYGNKFMGYLFVSIRSCNIPHKGEFHVEYIHDRPVIWYGFDAESNPNYEREYTNILKILVGLTNAFKGMNTIDKEDLLARINGYLARIKDQRKLMSSITGNIKQIKTQADKMSEMINTVYEDMCGFIHGANELAPEANESTFVCEHCRREFKTQNGKYRHANSCKKRKVTSNGVCESI